MTHYDFDSKAIDSVLEAAQQHNTALKQSSVNHQTDISSGGKLVLGATCISVTVQNGKVCINLPLGFGSVCLPIPAIFPSGTAAQACLDICTTWGVPTGIKVSVSVAGRTVVQQTFGYC
ncbi:hypothetical protein U1708_16675 [Sphingomonas sp. ZB1N12]|uniref:hypothetical protein n=1 Tax=Sphingomonas arabinosi TaxID=3096160 RepID=UPI002FC9CC70